MSRQTVRKISILAIIGFVIGIIVSLCFGWGFFREIKEGKETIGTFIRFLIIGGINGMICMGSTQVYDIESWSILRCTVTHFLITATSYFTMGCLQGWMNMGDISVVIITICILVGYFFIWLIMYLRYNREIRKMNEELKKMKDQDKEKDND